jgi:hypothetical protein
MLGFRVFLISILPPPKSIAPKSRANHQAGNHGDHHGVTQGIANEITSMINKKIGRLIAHEQSR